MKKLLLICSIFLTFTASAEVMQYRLYETSVDEFTPFVLSIEMNGPFQAGSKITKITLHEELKNKSTLLFSWNQKMVNRIFNYSWNQDNTLNLSTLDHPSFKSKVKNEINNPWGDTSINTQDKYNVYIEGTIILNQMGTVGADDDSVQFEIGNATQEESCLWGVLK